MPKRISHSAEREEGSAPSTRRFLKKADKNSHIKFFERNARETFSQKVSLALYDL
jgi:hypothetical protein